jgi:hypothetical protein
MAPEIMRHRGFGIALELIQGRARCTNAPRIRSLRPAAREWLGNKHRDKDKRREESVTTPTEQKIRAGAGAV